MCQLSAPEICEERQTPPRCDEIYWRPAWCLERGMVVKGNGVEETPISFGAHAITVMVLDKSVGEMAAGLQSLPVMGIRTKPKQSTSTATAKTASCGRGIMMGEVGTKHEIVDQRCYDGRGRSEPRNNGKPWIPPRLLGAVEEL